MQSPFPGMDPYLEASSLWPDVHHKLLSVARELLNRRLRPQYHVRVEERVYISDDNDRGLKAIIPDLKIVGSSFSPLATRRSLCAISMPPFHRAIDDCRRCRRWWESSGARFFRRGCQNE